MLKRLKNIEVKNEKQLKTIEDQGKKQFDEIKKININLKPIKVRSLVFFSKLSDEAKKLMEKIKIIDDWLDSAQLICTKADVKTKNDFNFMFPSKFSLKFFCRDLTLQKPKHDQKKLKILINRLNNDYNPKNLEKIK